MIPSHETNSRFFKSVLRNFFLILPIATPLILKACAQYFPIDNNGGVGVKFGMDLHLLIGAV